MKTDYYLNRFKLGWLNIEGDCSPKYEWMLSILVFKKNAIMWGVNYEQNCIRIGFYPLFYFQIYWGA